MTKISPFSDPPFSIFHKKITKKLKKKRIFFFLSKNLGSFASSKKGMNTFHYEMSKKWIFTFMNFQNVYWHGKAHSALATLGGPWRPCLKMTNLGEITRSVIFKSFSYMIFKIGPFPHCNPPKSPLKTKIFPQMPFYCLQCWKIFVAPWNPKAWLVKRA